MSAQNYCLHYVSDGDSPRRLAISQDELRHLVRGEREAGRRAASLAAYSKGEAPGAGYFTLSFDDAHTSILALAAPVLAELGVPGTLFVPTAYVGTSPEFLTWDEVRALRDSGWTIGSHSVSHHRLGQRIYDEDDAKYNARLSDECRRSRETLALELGDGPSLFAYPYGEITPAARLAVEEAGYSHAFTVAGSTEWDGDALAIPRVPGEGPARGEDDARGEEPTRISVVVPAYNRADILSEVVTRLASQSYPEDRYELIVVDDGSDDDLSPIFEDMPSNIRCVRHGDASFRAGQARQFGADLARFEVLAFLDADVVVDADYLWHLDWVHRTTADAVVFGYLSGYNLHSMGHVHRVDDCRGADLSTLSLIPDRSRESVLRTCLDNVEWLKDPWRLCYTGNLSFPKALLTRIGGFAQGFVGWGLEDVDLGYRLHQAGAHFVFSRYALGYHIEDASEASPNNPFRRDSPSMEDFDGYLRNLDILGERHSDDDVMREYVRQNIADVTETCSRPYTVGIEFGGAARHRSPHHAQLHRVTPGGVPEHELLDRIAYAKKVTAKSVYLLGGAPAEHPAFLRIVGGAKSAGLWVAMRSLVYPFAEGALAAEAKAAGLECVTCEMHSLDADSLQALFGSGGNERRERLLKGLGALAAAGIERRARVIVSPATLPGLVATLHALEERGIAVDEVEVTDPAISSEVQAISPVEVRPASP